MAAWAAKSADCSLVASVCCAATLCTGGVALAAGDMGPRVEVRGTRLTLGNAVACPTVRADDGTVQPVSYLPPDVAIGDRVTLRGEYAVTTRCVGRVIVVSQENSAFE